MEGIEIENCDEKKLKRFSLNYDLIDHYPIKLHKLKKVNAKKDISNI